MLQVCLQYFQGFQMYRGSKFAFSHWLRWSSLQQCCRLWCLGHEVDLLQPVMCVNLVSSDSDTQYIITVTNNLHCFLFSLCVNFFKLTLAVIHISVTLVSLWQCLKYNFLIDITWHNSTKMWSLKSIKITTCIIIPTIVLKWNNTQLLLVLFNNNKYFKDHKINIAHKLSICQSK